MSQAVNIHGTCPPRLDAVRSVFEAHFEAGEEIGARFAVAQHGEIILDLYAGHSDLARSRAFDAKTLTPIFSCTKAIASLMMARLVDQGLIAYDQPVAEVWPEFGAAGKAAITLEQVLSHQAGLCGLEGPFDPQLWYDPDAICTRLAAMAPLWPPGSASGYHPITVGYLVGEIFRRLDGRSLGTALRQDLGQTRTLRPDAKAKDPARSWHQDRGEATGLWHGLGGPCRARKPRLAQYGNPVSQWSCHGPGPSAANECAGL